MDSPPSAATFAGNSTPPPISGRRSPRPRGDQPEDFSQGFAVGEAHQRFKLLRNPPDDSFHLQKNLRDSTTMAVASTAFPQAASTGTAWANDLGATRRRGDCDRPTGAPREFVSAHTWDLFGVVAKSSWHACVLEPGGKLSEPSPAGNEIARLKNTAAGRPAASANNRRFPANDLVSPARSRR